MVPARVLEAKPGPPNDLANENGSRRPPRPEPTIYDGGRRRLAGPALVELLKLRRRPIENLPDLRQALRVVHVPGCIPVGGTCHASERAVDLHHRRVEEALHEAGDTLENRIDSRAV